MKHLLIILFFILNLFLPCACSKKIVVHKITSKELKNGKEKKHPEVEPPSKPEIEPIGPSIPPSPITPQG